MMIQFILILLSVLIVLYFLSNRNTMKVKAYKKIALLMFMLVVILFVLNPESLNELAHKVGVGRGADLLLYMLFISFVIFSVNVYLKFKEQQDIVFQLARKIALIEANEENKKSK